jgi:hypothetical protein
MVIPQRIFPELGRNNSDRPGRKNQISQSTASEIQVPSFVFSGKSNGRESQIKCVVRPCSIPDSCYWFTVFLDVPRTSALEKSDVSGHSKVFERSGIFPDHAFHNY